MERGGRNGIERAHEPNGKAVLVAEKIGKKYGEKRALDGVSLTINAGEVFCLIGPNGAGKTTLVRALTGTTDYEGQVSVFGSPPTEVDRSRVGLLPQEFSPATRLTARELLVYYAGLYDDARDPEALLSDLGLADSANTRYEDLSGGQRRRVCVGTALVNDPDILFLDEPTTGIDPAGRRALWRLLEERVAGGTTIFLTTHDMTEAERLGDRVGLLADGSLAEVGTPRKLVAAHGGESRLTIDLAGSADSGTGTGTGAGALSGTDYRTNTREGELVVYDISPEGIGDVIRELDGKDVAYDGLAWSQPTLDDAYLSLTGTAVGRGGDPVSPSSAPDSDDVGDVGDEGDGGDGGNGESEADGAGADIREDADTRGSADADSDTSTSVASPSGGKR